MNLLEPSGPVQVCNGIMFFLKPDGRRRSVGRPRLRWLKDVEGGLRKMKVRRWQQKKVNVYLSSLMMEVPDHVYVLG
jgi:hypothetical protein